MRPGHLAVLPLFLALSCDSKDTGDTGAAERGGGYWDEGDAADTGSVRPPRDSGEYEPPPESEDAFAMLPPASTDAYVFVANPERDTVTRVAVPALEVITVDVGSNPKVALTTPDYGKAVVFNQGSDDLSILDAETLDEQRIELREHLTSMVMSPDGLWVVCFRDADEVGEEEEEQEGEEGIESFNELSLVNLDSYEHFPMVVGANPRQVKFTEQGDMALVVSDQEVALIDLTVDVPAPVLVEVAEDPLDPPQAEEVVVAPNGEFAFVRQYGTSDIVVLDLALAEASRVAVGDNPTDLDITPDGRQAVVVCRGAQELWLLDAARPELEAEVIALPAEYTLGSVIMPDDGSTGVLYTTAELQDRYATWDIATGEITVRGLVKPVMAMSVSPLSESLLVFHTQENAAGADSTDTWWNAWALSLIDLDDFRANPMKLAAEPKAYSHADDGEHGYFIMEDSPWLVVLDYGTLLPDDIELKSVPVHVGTLPATEFAYASQEHDLGRISFYDSQEATLETITGFELNSEIEH